MNVTLDLEGSQMSDNVVDLFSKLTTKQKEKIAVQVLEKWFAEPVGFERIAFEEAVIRKVRDGSFKLGYDNVNEWVNKSDEQIKTHYAFRDHMKAFKGVREQMVETIVSEAVKVFNDKALDMIKNNPTYSAMWDKMEAQIMTDFPEIIKQSMMLHFANQMNNIQFALSQSLSNQGNLNLLKTNLTNILQTNQL
jgi:hypothetical protein